MSYFKRMSKHVRNLKREILRDGTRKALSIDYQGGENEDYD
jgi:hypothetical protein